jgi:hypothetical protein
MSRHTRMYNSPKDRKVFHAGRQTENTHTLAHTHTEKPKNLAHTTVFSMQVLFSFVCFIISLISFFIENILAQAQHQFNLLFFLSLKYIKIPEQVVDRCWNVESAINKRVLKYCHRCVWCVLLVLFCFIFQASVHFLFPVLIYV